MIQEKADSEAEFKKIKRAERERIRQSELKQKARREIIREEFPELQTGQSTKKRPPIPGYVQEAVFDRDGGSCVLCGSRQHLHFDHIVPYSKGGGDSVENLRLLCRDCNLRKGNRFS